LIHASHAQNLLQTMVFSGPGYLVVRKLLTRVWALLHGAIRATIRARQLEKLNDLVS
jgi:hypothetical protein